MAMSTLTFILVFFVKFVQPVFQLFGWYSDGPVLSSFCDNLKFNMATTTEIIWNAS